ncbi:MAG TPA: FMN-binding protein [Clostridia bacterium]|nr:FMN-binding protein [Clostridia bacterium]
MKRAFIATGATVIGVAWLLTYKATPPPIGALASVPPTPSAGNTSASPSVTPLATPSPSPKPSTSGTVNGTFTGSDAPNFYGDVVVRVVILNGHITDVQAVKLPTDRAYSAYVSQVAGPLLRTEALQAQSANIDIISGATYTSQSYAQSLGSALQQAHLG